MSAQPDLFRALPLHNVVLAVLNVAEGIPALIDEETARLVVTDPSRFNALLENLQALLPHLEIKATPCEGYVELTVRMRA